MKRNITFIALEGVDGSGKSTLANLLSKRLEALGHTAIVLKHPGETAAGAAMREIILNKDIEMHPLVQAQMVLANRSQTLIELEDRIKGVDGEIYVIADRWDMSTVAYQSAYYDTYIDSIGSNQIEFYRTLVGLVQTNHLAMKSVQSLELHAAVCNPIYVQVIADDTVRNKRLDNRGNNERFENQTAKDFFNVVNWKFKRIMSEPKYIPRRSTMLLNVTEGAQHSDADVLLDMVMNYDAYNESVSDH